MELIHSLSDWITSFADSPYGSAVLMLLAFAESSFFPIPPDVLQIPLSIANTNLSFVFATIATIGSVLGGMFGYFIGNKGGKPILSKLVNKEKVALVEHYYKKYDVWAVGIAGFSPIPYKIFTITAGVFNLDFKRFVIASIISRAGRFYLVATFIYIFGPAVKIYMDKYFNVIVLGFTALLIGGFLFINYFSKRIAKQAEKEHDHTWQELKK
ncbi:MAG: hypothetical protein UU81_C0004G0024 [Microgenomates group bacterium GW2011_GWC1_41_8]|uniref:VTT domain-containing protein n=2 Tax=Candidatus Roizmaniibacteriota TaxID=1752723 RepID=A0A0G0X744_9BACT|nr:MAG: hypothetical protein UU41_C0032G0004 [Candidatus Roizmanbacteria bacterium GW2011_GWA1_41_13]KKS20760.1 MAG: hypothetical protein UU78_C0053G0004 [Candidatus Roizmanbacteria bacterium GW2011_GWC2_41_7]KKS24627.1 MAG: hypothetical protein UU81_C0004G0024 [Microgenomates group bacterium GW2011_GWC1_41_8]